jgi:hypothetical protein
MEGISMTFLSEDPTYLTVGFVVLAAGFVSALRVTQQGKYLVLACATVGLAVVTLAVEQLWVTDNERIERVVYELGEAVKNSNPDAVISQLAPNVQYSKEDSTLSPDATRQLISSNIGRFKFDLLRVGHLKTHVSEQARRGTAEFQVIARATQQRSAGSIDSGTAVTTWSLGFQETGPGIWKVARISPVAIPSDVLAFTGGTPRPDRMRLGFQHGPPGREHGRGAPNQRPGLRGRGRYPIGPHPAPPTDID